MGILFIVAAQHSLDHPDTGIWKMIKILNNFGGLNHLYF
jgi:hypothetical protein